MRYRAKEFIFDRHASYSTARSPDAAQRNPGQFYAVPNTGMHTIPFHSIRATLAEMKLQQQMWDFLELKEEFPPSPMNSKEACKK
jgi:hypothetical protein